MSDKIKIEGTDKEVDFDEIVPDELKELFGTGDDNPFTQWAFFLEMPDDQFKIFAPLLIEETEKELTKDEIKMTLAQSFNIKGFKIEDIEEAFAQLDEIIDKEFSTYSDYKREILKEFFGLFLNALQESKGVYSRLVQVPIVIGANGKIPEYAHPGDAAVDLYAAESKEIMPGAQDMIETDIKVAIPKGYALLVQPRSGISARSKLRIPNTPGLIDSNYRGSIKILVENIEPKIKDILYDFLEDGTPIIKGIIHGSPIQIEKGTRIAQARLVEVPTMYFQKMETLDDTERGEKGFGSSGQ